MDSLKALSNLFVIVDQECPIHHINMMQPKGHPEIKPSCKLCTAEAIKQESMQRQKDLYKQQEDYTSNRLLRLSRKLLDRPSDLDYHFSQWQATDGTKERQLATKAYKQAEWFVQNPKDACHLLLLGGVGTGKTMLAASIANYLSTKGQQPFMMNINTALRHLRSSFKDPSEFLTEARLMDLVSEADVAIIDDLGSESLMRDSVASEYTQQILYQLLNAQERMVITSNLSFKGFQHAYNPKIVSRLFDNAIVIDFSGVLDKRVRQKV